MLGTFLEDLGLSTARCGRQLAVPTRPPMTSTDLTGIKALTVREPTAELRIIRNAAYALAPRGVRPR
jgi:hypothetical protein